MLRFTFEVAGEVQIDRTLARMADDVGDARELWNNLADDFAGHEQRLFRTEGASGGNRWAALSPDYAAWKRRAVGDQPILVLYDGNAPFDQESGLRRSLTRRPFGVEVIEPGYMILGTDVSYARHHQAGSGSLPRRRVVSLTEATRRSWVKRIQRFIVTGDAGGRD